MCVPYKSLPYVKKRYYKHPSYRYHIYALENKESIVETLLVLRIQECNGSRALWLIDCIGNVNNLKNSTSLFDELMNTFNCEYVDVYEAGINAEIFIEGGWEKVNDEGNIIPDYFAPFEQKNVNIYFSMSDNTAVLFKGDGDQDRPN